MTYIGIVRKKFAKKQLIVRSIQMMKWYERTQKRKKVKELLGQLRVPA